MLKKYIMRFSNVIVLVLLLSCTEESRLEDFDTEGWKQDKMGCKAHRITLIDELMSRQNEITGLGQEEVIKLLGKPDRHELYSRNKKSFTYFLVKGPDCDKAIGNPAKLVIRYDGLGRSKDIIYYKKD